MPPQQKPRAGTSHRRRVYDKDGSPSRDAGPVGCCCFRPLPCRRRREQRQSRESSSSVDRSSCWRPPRHARLYVLAAPTRTSTQDGSVRSRDIDAARAHAARSPTRSGLVHWRWLCCFFFCLGRRSARIARRKMPSSPCQATQNVSIHSDLFVIILSLSLSLRCSGDRQLGVESDSAVDRPLPTRIAGTLNWN